MAGDPITLVGSGGRSVGLTGGELTGAIDVTKKLVGGANSADGLCAQYGVDTVVMPDNCKLLVSTQAAGGPVVLNPRHARNWVTANGNGMGDIGVDNGCQFVLDMVTRAQWLGHADGSPSPDGVVTIFSYNNFSNGLLNFRINGQAEKQMSKDGPGGDGTHAPGDLDGSGNLKGFACHGIRSDKCVNPEMHVSVINTRTINTTGHVVDGSYGKASAFAIETVGVKGGLYYVEFDTQDGSIGSECLVFHGVQAVGTAWIVKSLRSQRMFRGVGCYSGGQGEVHDLVVHNLYTQDDQKIPGLHKILAKAINIESGGSDSAPPTPGPIKLYAPQSTNSPEFVTVNNNRGTANGRVELYGNDNTPGYSKVGFSKNDGNSINFGGTGPCTDGVYITDFHFENPDTAIVNGTNAQGACVYMGNCTFSPVGATKAAGGASAANGMSAAGDQGRHPWGLTFGAGQGNQRPTLSRISPANGSTVPTNSTAHITCDAADDHDAPGSGLTAVGQAYFPAVSILSITVASLTATLVASAAHRATAGTGHVRVTGSTVAGLNGDALPVLTVSTTNVANDTLTYAVANGTSSETGHGTVEPLGAAITMVADGTTGFKSQPDWSTPTSQNQTRTIEITATDSGPSPVGVTTISTGLFTSTTNNPPLVAVVPPFLGKINPAAGQTLSVIVIDPNPGDTINTTTHPPAWVLKDSTNTAVVSAGLTATTPAVSTTIGAAIDVTTLNGEATDTVTLASTTGASTTGGTIAVAHGLTGLVVIQYAGVSGTKLTGCQLLAGTGTLTVGDTVSSTNYTTATFDASGLTPGATYQAQATVYDNHDAPGASLSIPVVINKPPVVAWNFPATAQTVAGTITLTGSASDDGGVSSGHVYNIDSGESLIGTLAIADGTWTYSLDTTTLTDTSDHSLRVKVADALGLVGRADITFHVDQSQTDTTPPTIVINFPNGTVLTVPTEVIAFLADNVAVASGFIRIDLGGGQFRDLPMSPT